MSETFVKWTKDFFMPQSKIHRYLRHGMLPQLVVFEAVARLESFTRASEALHLSQPTISTQIKKLSETLDSVLFEQIGKKIYLTPAGQSLYLSCTEIFSALSNLEENLANMRSLEAGKLRIAVSTTGKYFILRLLSKFIEKYPNVEISLQGHNRKNLIQRLEHNDDDLYIFSNPSGDVELIKQVILPNPMVIFARANHPLASKNALSFRDLELEPFIMREIGSGTRMIADDLFYKYGIKPKVRLELSTNEAIKQAILAGLGIAILSRYTLGLDEHNSEMVELDVQDLPIECQWQFVYPVGKVLPPIAIAFLEFCRRGAGTIPVPKVSRHSSVAQ
jgi:DNA-binding transcriptional LysR family regulator